MKSHWGVLSAAVVLVAAISGVHGQVSFVLYDDFNAKVLDGALDRARLRVRRDGSSGAGSGDRGKLSSVGEPSLERSHGSGRPEKRRVSGDLYELGVGNARRGGDESVGCRGRIVRGEPASDGDGAAAWLLLQYWRGCAGEPWCAAQLHRRCRSRSAHLQELELCRSGRRLDCGRVGDAVQRQHV